MKRIKFTKGNIALCGILLLSAILNFANLSIEGYGNSYYAAGVKSMMINFKNFFFVSFDPSGFVSIDKPPLGFWIQTISAKIFGFSGWSILFPEALAGVISVALVYYIVKRSFGTAAGLISALFLTITPVFIATSRNNTIDNLLVVTLLIACLFLSKAAEKGNFKYLIISLVLVGIGFNIKMLEAYMVAPALYITYLISSAAPVKKRLKHLVIGSIILIAVSFSWAIVVDLVPSQYRPFVGSSTNNTVIELISGHNGIARLSGSSGGMGGGGGAPGEMSQNQKSFKNNMQQSTSNMKNTNENAAQSGNPGGTPPSGSPGNNNSGAPNSNTSKGNTGRSNGGGPGGGGPGGSGLSGSFGGQTTAGITRLFSKNILSDQIVWFLPLALLGFIAAAIKEKLKAPFDNKKKLDLVMWIVWLLPEFLYFSYTKGLFHPYYLTMLAPPIAALSGIGITSMWKLYKGNGIKAYLLPVTLIATGLVHLLMLSYFTNLSSSIRYTIIAALVICFASSIILIIYKIIKGRNLNANKHLNFAKAFTALAIIGILATPAIGSSAAITHSISGTIPCGGLELLSNSGSQMMGGGHGEMNSSNTKLISFLESHTSTEKYMLVVSSSNSAEDIILKSGKGVMTLGGFSGSDNIITLSKFKELVKNGEVRYVLTGGMQGGSNDIMNWVKKNGKAVSESQWKNTTTSNNQLNKSNKSSTKSGFSGFDHNNSEALYDLKGSVK